MTDPRRDRVTADGIAFEYLAWGDGDRLALCLHGFPDDAGTFAPLAARLTDAGFTVVAPYMRGYGPTERPSDGDYSAGALGRDAIALADKLGGESPLLVGHDWGAVAAYTAASIAPERFSHVAAMAVPPDFPSRALARPRQWLRSWYMAFIQLPDLPERALRAGEFALIDLLWRLWSPGWDYPDERIEAVTETFRTPGTVEAALAYYRQFARGLMANPPFGGGGGGDGSGENGGGSGGIETSALVVAGERDGCIGSELFAGADAAFAGACRVVAVRGAGHFMHLERPDVVAEEILTFVER
jgi:pimeloyl-ACP methyl ester carboxylesterase